MTAELESQAKEEEKTEENEKAAEEEKDAKAATNGSTNDSEKKNGKEEKEIEIQVEDSKVAEETAKASPRQPGLFGRLFKRFKKSTDADVEAGTELLAKTDDLQSPDKDQKADGDHDTNKIVADEKAEEALEEGKGINLMDAHAHRLQRLKKAAGCVALVVLIAVVLIITACIMQDRAPRGPMVDPIALIDCGQVSGVIQDNIYVFKGIPYALPPTKDHRWKAPRPPSNLGECWNGTYEALNASAHCYQKPIVGVDMEMSEDCLYLDIITPSLAPPKLRPVVVYIPGDYPLQGFTAADIRWRPSIALADEKDVTFVTIQYRMGVFGFMALDILNGNSHPPTTGNYGLMDMLAALRWVQNNIRAFGGDPKRVTVLGHGGGATAGLALLSSRKASDLFAQLWLSAPSAYFTKRNLTDIGKDNSQFLKKLNCNNVECLYNKTSEEIFEATPSFWAADLSFDLPSAEEEKSPVMTVSDGIVLHDMANTWSSNSVNKVPVVIGSGAQESGSSKLLPGLDTWSWTDFSEYISEKLGTINTSISNAAIEYYTKNTSTPMEQLHSMISDIRTICPLEQLTSSLAGPLNNNVYWYIVDYKPTSALQFSNDSSASSLSIHGMDIAAIFGLLKQYMTSPSPADLKFQENVQALFYNYVFNGVPGIYKEDLMPSGFVNFIGSKIRSNFAPYENCRFWNYTEFIATYAKVN